MTIIIMQMYLNVLVYCLNRLSDLYYTLFEVAHKVFFIEETDSYFSKITIFKVKCKNIFLV